ncbi:MAG: GH3 domain-containing protein [Dehalococcoidales bacterium]
MPKAIDLIRQGRNEDLWQMCCGFLSLNIQEFMEIQNNLLLQQLELLNDSPLGKRLMRGANPQTVSEFRRIVPLTSYKDYCPGFMEKQEESLPSTPEFWVRTSGWSGDYPCKWFPMTSKYAERLSEVLCGVGILSCCKDWGDVSQIPENIKLLYSVAPRPYISGTFADLLRTQVPLKYLPNLEKAEKSTYEERISTGFKQALSEGLDFFFGLSTVLVKVGEKLRDSSSNMDMLPYLIKPRSLWRLMRAKIKSRLAKRPMLPKDIWSLKGIIGSGVDSSVYKEKIKELWGHTPLDIYSCTEGGVIATQTWDYAGMTFVPSLNFFEFIPEDELTKWQMDRSYKMKTVLLDEVEPGEVYEIVFTNFHGGSVIRYRVGDLIRITSLRNDNLGIDIPQMVFERRADDLINFMVIKLTEKLVWQALEKANILYEDWVAYKIPGEPVLRLLIEPKENYAASEAEMTRDIEKYIIESGRASYESSGVSEDWRNSLDFSTQVTLLPHGTFSSYTRQRQLEGADLAHIKPPHVNPSEKVLSYLLPDIDEIIVVEKPETTAEVPSTPENSLIS